MRLILFLLSACLPLVSHAQFVYQPSPDIAGDYHINRDDLCQVAKNTLSYIKRYPQDNFAVHAGQVFTPAKTLTRVTDTLNALCQLPAQQIDAEYLKQHFDFYQWLPDKKTANNIARSSTNATKKRMLENIPEDQIFLTKYYVKLLNASEKQTAGFDQALYAIPFDEQTLTTEEADKQKNLTRFQYTRQQIIAGELGEKNLAQPLVWLSEEALHDVLLQGTGVANVDGKRRYFNVHRNNGIAYDYAIGKRDQARYWYFAEVPGILGYGTDIDNKIPLKDNVAFAGNVKQLGLGKLFLVKYKNGDNNTIQMGVLADQGGAFDNNLFQLDLLRGSYYGWKDYHQANKQMADYASAWLLLKKEL